MYSVKRAVDFTPDRQAFSISNGVDPVRDLNYVLCLCIKNEKEDRFDTGSTSVFYL